MASNSVNWLYQAYTTVKRKKKCIDVFMGKYLQKRQLDMLWDRRDDDTMPRSHICFKECTK